MVVSGGFTPAVAVEVGAGWAVVAPGAGAAVADGVGVVAGAAAVAGAVAVATGVGDCTAYAGVPAAGTETKPRTSAANNAVFIRKEFTFIFHETAAQPTSQLNGRGRPKNDVSLRMTGRNNGNSAPNLRLAYPIVVES
jgi:hypothetical protein